MVRRGSFIGGQDNLSVPDAPTIGAATAGNTQVSVAFTAPSDVGDDPITNFGVSVFPATGTTKTFRVTVASGNLYGGGTGNVFYIDGVGNPELTLVKGFTYVFDQEDSSNSGHPFHFKNTSDSQYTTGVTVTGTAGQSGAKVTLVLAEDASEPSAYYCTAHGNGMGNTITLVAPSASDDPLGQAQYTNTGSSSPITVTGLSNGTSYVAKVWAINDYGNGPLSDATSSFTPNLHRGIFGGNRTGAGRSNTIDYVSIASTGDAQDFGDLTQSRQINPSLMSSTTRTVFAAGISDSVTYANTLDYVTIASTGNATDFGDLSVGRYNAAACSNEIRGIQFNGDQQTGTDNTIDYITIASTGNATDFANMNITTFSGGASSSPTRGVRFGGGSSDEISYVTIVSTGNAVDFGNLTVARYNAAGASSNTRVCMAGGEGASKSNVIDYITTASTGNATDFGDLNNSLQGAGGTSNGTRGLFAGGEGSSYVNVIDFITIASTGNASDFGDLTIARNGMSCGSDAHGGINETEVQAFAPAAMGLIMAGRFGYPGETHIGYVDIATTGNTISFGDLITPRSQAAANGSSTRAVSYAGYGEANGTTVSNIIEYVEFSTKGKATDFGDASANSYAGASASNGTRGVFALGYSGGYVNTIDYITIASPGNATDFGDLSVTRAGMARNINSTTRGVFAGGVQFNVIDYITIASTGNATDFGDTTIDVYYAAGGGSSTRGIVGGGNDFGNELNVIQYITIASTGNATDFGDLTDARHTYGGMSSSTRMIFGSDNRASGSSDVLDYVTIASTGNATDFGDALIGIESAYTSNSHGGIS